MFEKEHRRINIDPRKWYNICRIMAATGAATNSFCCDNIKTHEKAIIPNDLLIKLKGLTKMSPLI